MACVRFITFNVLILINLNTFKCIALHVLLSVSLWYGWVPEHKRRRVCNGEARHSAKCNVLINYFILCCFFPTKTVHSLDYSAVMSYTPQINTVLSVTE